MQNDRTNGHRRTPVVVLGATGMVGQRAVQLLHEHPWFEVVGVAASPRSAGKRYADACRWVLPGTRFGGVGELTVQQATPEAFAGQPGVALSALDREVAGSIEVDFANAGWAVVSNAASHRFTPNVPLVIPEVNPHHLDLIERQPWSGCIVANPNCTSMPLAMTLAPLDRAVGVESVCVASYQAVSGAGYPGESAWDMIANVRPHPGNEEVKLACEPLKILGALESEDGSPRIVISGRCVRAPVVDGHLIAVQVKTTQPLNPSIARELWLSYNPELDLPSSPTPLFRVCDELDRPSPRFDAHEGDGMAVSIGRIEQCPVMGLKYFALAHNTIRGAAGAAILNAELLVQRGIVNAN